MTIIHATRRKIATHALTLLAATLVSLIPRAAFAQTATSTAASPNASQPRDAHASHWDFSLDLGGSSAIYALPDPNKGEGRLGYFTDAKLTRFIDPLIDDASPRSLQPFLQRSSTVLGSIGLDGSGRGAHEVTPVGNRRLFSSANVGARAQIAADIYALPWLALTAGFDYDYDYNLQTRLKLHHFGPHGGFGVRLGDTRVDASYTFGAYDELSAFPGHVFFPIRWGTVSLDLESVVARRLAIRFGVKAFDGGEGGSGSIAYYFTKNVGVSVGGFGYKGLVYQNIDDSQVVHNDYGLTVGADWWVNRVVRLGVDYQLSGTTIPRQLYPGTAKPIPSGNSLIDNQVTLGASFRL